jgi:acyl dehydratase
VSTTSSVPDEIRPGLEIPDFVRVPGFHHFNRYAAVNSEFVPIHMDDEAGREAGYDRAFGMGNLQGAYIHDMLRTWTGPEGRIVRVSCQFRAPALRDRMVRARGTVTGVERVGTELIVDLDIHTEDDDGNVLAPGTARVAVPV